MAPKKKPISRAKKPTTPRTSRKDKEVVGAKPDVLPGRDKAGKFTKGNHIWEARAAMGSFGRAKKFTPEQLWEAAQEYFSMYDANPIIVIDYKGKDALRVNMPKQRAYTWQSLELYLDLYSLRDYKTNPKYSEYSQVIARIERTMYASKFEAAAAGVMNPSIIARDLGLREQTHMTLDDDRRVVGDVFPSELDDKKE